MSQVTKRALEASLKHLLLQKPLNKITINDIAEDCGINRMTFYYHFKDIYDLVEWCCEEDASRADFCPGRDIVCAGASALVCALAGALDALGAQGVQRTLCAGHAAIAADDRADVRAAFTVAVTGLRQLAAAYPGHVAEDTGRVPAQETKPNGSATAGRCPGAVPGSGQQRKKET